MLRVYGRFHKTNMGSETGTVRGASVGLGDPSGKIIAWVNTDSNGEYRVPLPAGTHSGAYWLYTTLKGVLYGKRTIVGASISEKGSSIATEDVRIDIIVDRGALPQTWKRVPSVQLGRFGGTEESPPVPSILPPGFKRTDKPGEPVTIAKKRTGLIIGVGAALVAVVVAVLFRKK